MAKTVYFLDTKNNNVFETSHPEYHNQEQNQRISKEEYKKKKHQQDREEMLKSIKPNDTIYTQVLTVSSSGMSRTIKFYIVDNNRIRDISGYVASLTGNKWAKNGGVTFSGCGMDMAWHGVYSLGLALWPNGTPEPHGNRNGEPDDNGGYALKHSHM